MKPWCPIREAGDSGIDVSPSGKDEYCLGSNTMPYQLSLKSQMVFRLGIHQDHVRHLAPDDFCKIPVQYSMVFSRKENRQGNYLQGTIFLFASERKAKLLPVRRRHEYQVLDPSGLNRSIECPVT